jgi:hypothetical protein
MENERKLEKGDLDIYVSMGFIVQGPLADFFSIRDYIRGLAKSRLIYLTASSRKLMIKKEGRFEKE